jgi:hypothetical protein
MSKNSVPVATQAVSRIDDERPIISWMRFGERLVVGLWTGLVAANIAILASALPYIYAQEDPISRVLKSGGDLQEKLLSSKRQAIGG